MPVLVVGADTVHGTAISRALDARDGDKRAFVSDEAFARGLRERGWHVAVGDVSDGSHVGGAAMGCFTVVLVPEAAFDDRERSFARSPAATITAWSRAVEDAGVRRVIWLDDPRVEGVSQGLIGAAPELAVVPTQDISLDLVAREVARLDDLESLPEA